jgi:hypothetical protein
MAKDDVINGYGNCILLSSSAPVLASVDKRKRVPAKKEQHTSCISMHSAGKRFSSGALLRNSLNVCLFASVMMLFFAGIVYADTPLGSMVIYGPNGTDVTGTRNVHLNLTYSSSDGIGRCAWANDAESNLATAPLENCTTVKAWILSESYGNYRVRDAAGHTADYNDSIMYIFMQDYTAPTPPTVYDGTGTDIDWSNSNTTLSANWVDATDDISIIYYKYRIFNDTGCINVGCDLTNAGMNTSATATNLALLEGERYYFEVVAYNPFGLNSSGLSNGTIIDLTKPNPPTINSSTHPDQATPSNTPTAIFNFSAVDILGGGVMSGIDGYSYVLDSHQGTAPDNRMEEREWHSIASMIKGSYNQTLKANITGPAYAVFSQLHTNITQNDSVRVTVALAEQFSDRRDLMGVNVYLVKTTNEGDAITAFNMMSNAITNIANYSWDVKYAEDMSRSKVYQFDLVANQSIDDNLKDIYVVVSGIVDDDNNNNTFAIAGTTSIIDNTTRNYVCDESNNCHANTSTLDYAIAVSRQDSGSYMTARYDYLGDGTYYFHVKAVDKAGNWGDASHYRAMVSAGGVSSLVYSPVDGEAFYANGTSVNITVGVSVGRNVSVKVIAKHYDGSNFTSAAYQVTSSKEFENIALELDLNEIYAITNTSSGALAVSPSVFVTVSQIPPVPTNRTLRITYTGCSGSSYLCNFAEGTNFIGIATENGVISAPSVQADTTNNAIQIYMSRGFDTLNIANQFAQGLFLDRINPMFGYVNGASLYVIQNELRYGNIYLGGDFKLPPGYYNIYLRKSGIAADGRQNITVMIR